jgi:hypothetical protein
MVGVAVTVGAAVNNATVATGMGTFSLFPGVAGVGVSGSQAAVKIAPKTRNDTPTTRSMWRVVADV